MYGTTPAVLRRRLATAVLATATLVIAGAAPALSAEYTDVTPELVPKADLPLAPDCRGQRLVAPAVPPPSGRTEPAIVEVAFEVVENVTAIDPGHRGRVRDLGLPHPRRRGDRSRARPDP